MAFALLLISTILLIYLIVSDAKSKNVDIITGAVYGIGFFNILPIWLLVIARRFPNPDGTTLVPVSWVRDEKLVALMLIMVALSMVSLLGFRKFCPKKYLTGGLKKTGRDHYFSLGAGWAFIGYLAVSIALFLAAGLGQADSHWARSKSEFQEEQGTLGMIVGSLQSSVEITILIAIASYWLKHGFSRLTVLMALAVVGADMYLTGNRILAFQFLMVVLCVAMTQKKYLVIMLLLAMAPPFAYSMTLFASVRSQMYSWDEFSVEGAQKAIVRGYKVAQNKNKKRDSFLEYLMEGSEAGSLNVLGTVVEDYPKKYPYLFGTTLGKVFVFWVPRSIWPNKPLSFQFVLGDRYVGEGVSLNATLLGEMYGNFGVFGSILLPPVLLFILVFLGRIGYLFRMLRPLDSFEWCALGFSIGLLAMRNSISTNLLIFGGTVVFLSFVKINFKKTTRLKWSTELRQKDSLQLHNAKTKPSLLAQRPFPGPPNADASRITEWVPPGGAHPPENIAANDRPNRSR